MVRFTLALLLITVAVLSACSSDGTPSTAVLTELSELERVRQLWNENEPEAYQYVITWRCLSCTPHVPGESALVTVDSTGIKHSASTVGDATGSRLTIAAAFDWIVELVLRDFYHRREISYDPTYGYPVSVRAQDSVGHGFVLTVTDFQLDGPV